MTTLEISNIAAACGKNPYENKQKIMLLLLCRKYKAVYKEIFKNLGVIEYISKDIKTKTLFLPMITLFPISW